MMGLRTIFIVGNQTTKEDVSYGEMKGYLLGKFIEKYREIIKGQSEDQFEAVSHRLVVTDSTNLTTAAYVEGTSPKIERIKNLTTLFAKFKHENSANLKRTTLADLGDQLIAIQLCCKDKDLDSLKSSTHSSTWKTYQNLMKVKSRYAHKENQTCNELSQDDALVWQKYDAFCQRCNMKDIVDFCNESCTKASKDIIDVVLLDDRRKEFEMIFVACLLQHAENIKLVNIAPGCVDVTDASKEVALKTLENSRGNTAVEQGDASSTSGSSSENTAVDLSPLPSRQPVIVGSSSQKTSISSQNNSVFYPETPKSCAKNQLKKILLSYLRLLINTRDEIALARVINAPNRDLYHRAFTDLRKTAEMKGLPMFQTAVSFVLQMRLGGKGYAPGDHCVLKQHIKGLSDFVTLMHKLQNIVEDSPDPREAVKLILRSLRLAFVKSKVLVFATETVTDCVDELHKQLSDRFDRMSTVKDIPKSTIVELKVVLALKSLLEEEAVASFSDFENGERISSSILSTPDVNSSLIKLPSLNSQFKTPEQIQAGTPKRACIRKQRDVDVPSKRKVIGDMRWAPVTNSLPIKRNWQESQEAEGEPEARVPEDTRHKLDREIGAFFDEEIEVLGDKDISRPTEISLGNKENMSETKQKQVMPTNKNKNIAHSKKQRRQDSRDEKIEKVHQKTAPKKSRAKKSTTGLLAGQKSLTNFFKKCA